MKKDEQRVNQWLETHPFLEEIGRFSQGVEGALKAFEATQGATYDWESYREDFLRGIPLLNSTAVSLPETAAAADLFLRLIAEVAANPLPPGLKNSCQKLATHFAANPSEGAAAIDALLRGEGAASEEGARLMAEESGLIWFFGWKALARVLEPALASFALWRNDDQWMKGYCPTCGSLPAMAQLVRTGKGRERYLSCGCCNTRWLYKRIGCPFCGNEVQEQLGLLDLEEEEDLRIDVCHSCKGYLKTYTNEGEERLMLADWSSLHLDVLSRERGFKRTGAFLYQL